MSRCPVCGGAGHAVLSLPAQPIYQHPVPPGVSVPAPHTLDLAWHACDDCSHAWQPSFDAQLLASIYRSYYYTPAPGGIAVQFREDFLAALAEAGLLEGRRVLLEIGCSAGEVLAELVARTGAALACGFEPNTDNAVVARARGLDVRQRFFGRDAAREGLPPVDLLFSRHVIEHVFDFEDFFAGVVAVCAPGAALVLETPSLDFHAIRGSLDPFHIEHVHVFALRSLARLAARHGFGLVYSTVTGSGNLIAAFRAGAPVREVPAPELGALQAAVDARRARLRELFADRTLAFWGAGSSGVELAHTLGREPDAWTDGNPGKVGKRFVGLRSDIVAPAAALARLQAPGSRDAALVITSSFFPEILPRVRELGWQGATYDTAGRLL
jgi:SAM-dependent methyltransferase